MGSRRQPPEIEAALLRKSESRGVPVLPPGFLIEVGRRERDRQRERTAHEIAAKAIERANADVLGYRLNAIEDVLSTQVVARASIKIRAIQILLAIYHEAEPFKPERRRPGPLLCTNCGHRMGVHPRLTAADPVAGWEKWSPGVCQGVDGEGCAAECGLFEQIKAVTP